LLAASERKLAELPQERRGRWPVRPTTLYRVK